MYVIIVGAGKVGLNLARELIDKEHEVTLLEADRRRYLVVEDELEHAVQYGDATELWVLERAGIQRADLVVAVTGDDEDNMLVCQVAKEKYLCERVIARVNNPRNLQHFKLLGIQPVVSATDLILRLIEHEVPRYGLVHLLALEEERLEIIELEVQEAAPAADKRVADVTLPQGSLIISVLRDGRGFVPTARHGRRGRRPGPARARLGPRGPDHAGLRPELTGTTLVERRRPRLARRRRRRSTLARVKARLLALAAAAAVAAPATASAQSQWAGTSAELRAAVTRLLDAELAGDGGTACAILYAPLTGVVGGRSCTQRWDARLSRTLKAPGGRARIRADLRAVPAAAIAMNGDWATIALPHPLLDGDEPLLLDRELLDAHEVAGA